MIAFEEACKKAVDHFAETDKVFGLASALETDIGWIFYGGSPDEPVIGAAGVLVGKKDGSMKEFILPDRENFKLLNAGVEVEIPEEFKG